ncbi:MAG TPA: hypothetical protein VGH95_00955 [Candidatus Aquirickettsiella sp.]
MILNDIQKKLSLRIFAGVVGSFILRIFSDSILHKAQNQINVVKKGVHAILNVAEILEKDPDKIAAMFLDEAANEFFNTLFENKEISELNSECEQSWKFKKNAQKDCLKKLLKLILHQNFIFSNATRGWTLCIR